MPRAATTPPPAADDRVQAMASPAGASVEPASYESALQELETLVQRMESQQLPLDQLLDGYRRGAELLGFCRSRLVAVEQQVRVLEDGQLKDWGVDGRD